MSLKNLLRLVVNRLPALNSSKMASAEALQRLESRAAEAENLISLLKAEVITFIHSTSIYTEI